MASHRLDKKHKATRDKTHPAEIYWNVGSVLDRFRSNLCKVNDIKIHYHKVIKMR